MWSRSTSTGMRRRRRGDSMSVPILLSSLIVLSLATIAPLWSWSGTDVKWMAVQFVRSVLPAGAVDNTPTIKALFESIEWDAWRSWECQGHHSFVATTTIPDLLAADWDRSFPALAQHSVDVPRIRSEVLSVAKLMERPGLGDLWVDYFTDARQVNATTPDARAPLADIVRNISLAGGPEKIGTQRIVSSSSSSSSHHPYPPRHNDNDSDSDSDNDDHEEDYAARFLRVVMESAPILGTRFGTRRLGIPNPLLTVPVFLATGQKPEPTTTSMSTSTSTSTETTRTDLHAEPIGNVVLQIEGRKRWTLVPAHSSWNLRPSLSPDGRAYFLSRRHPNEHLADTGVVPLYYEVITEPGDLLWIPPWTWHKVEYIEGCTSLSASLFHFRPLDFFWNNPIFAALILPNIAKEVLGLNKQ